MQHIRNIRLSSQQLVKPRFSLPEDVVSFMGAVQAQDYGMAKWALALRLNKPYTNQDIEKAFNKGKIVRTHILRPTWHFVHADDIRWMILLSGNRIKMANKSLGKYLDIEEYVDNKVNNLLENVLGGGNALTKQELSTIFEREGIPSATPYMSRFLMNAEAEGIICSGPVKSGKHSYMLLEERVPEAKKITKDEALAKLATAYFRSHSPADLNDFVWWSGLSLTEARQAIKSIEEDLITESFHSRDFYIYRSIEGIISDERIHFLPSYDEYLISYKNRTEVLSKEYCSKAHNTFGIFYPVVLHKGEVVGNWKKQKNKTGVVCDVSFFQSENEIKKTLVDEADRIYQDFIR